MNYHGFFVILHSSRMVMYMKSKVIIFLLLFIGSISFIAGSYSLYRLYDKSNRMEHTVGVVTDLKTERIYRNRKVDTSILPASNIKQNVTAVM